MKFEPGDIVCVNRKCAGYEVFEKTKTGLVLRILMLQNEPEYRGLIEVYWFDTKETFPWSWGIDSQGESNLKKVEKNEII